MDQKIFARASILLHDMRHQAQVVFNEDVSRLQVSLGASLEVVLFFLLSQGTGEAAGG